MKKIAALLTVHNRKEETLSCLSLLYKQSIPEGYSFDVFLTDDGCTDGTPEAIREKYPQVHIIQGDGTLFWNRGMYVAWKAAAKNKDYDFYLWLNDDTMLYQNAIETLFRIEQEEGGNSIVVGSICSPKDPNRITYGGRDKNGLIHPQGEIKPTKNFNGNVVLIPNSIFHVLGFNDPFFHHAFGDSDYGYRAFEHGFRCFVTDVFVGECERHDESRKCWNSKYDIITRFKYLYSPLGYPPKEVFYYYRKHWGIWQATIAYFRCQLKTLFPYIKFSHKK